MKSILKVNNQKLLTFDSKQTLLEHQQQEKVFPLTSTEHCIRGPNQCSK